MQIVLVKYFYTKQDPVNGSVEHLPIPVLSQSQLNAASLQNSGKLQLSIFKKVHPLPLPQVIGSAKEKLTFGYHPVDSNSRSVKLLT